MFHQDNARGILIFATEADLRQLVQCTTMLVDGTFKTSPHPYVQMFTIHGYQRRFVLKFACGLLADKSEATYRRVFEVLGLYIKI